MWKYLKLIQLYWFTTIAAQLEYRLNFAIATLSSVLSITGSLFTISLFYQKGYEFQGWSWQETLIVVGIFNFLQGFASTFLMANLNQIVKQVEQGTLDFVLLRPVNSQFALSFKTFSLWGLPDMVFGLVLMGYGGTQLGLTWINYLSGVIPFSCSLLTLYSIWFIFGATSVWFVKIYNVTEVLRGLLEAGRFPMAAYPATYRFFFTFIVPIAFLTTIPAEAILNRANPPFLLGSIALAISIFIVSTQFWKFALRFYTSASS